MEKLLLDQNTGSNGINWKNLSHNQKLSYQGCHIQEKSWIFFAVLKSSKIVIVSPGKYLESFSVIYPDKM